MIVSLVHDRWGQDRTHEVHENTRAGRQLPASVRSSWSVAGTVFDVKSCLPQKTTYVTNDTQLMVDNPSEPRATVKRYPSSICNPSAVPRQDEARCCSLLFEEPKPSLRRAERIVPGQIKARSKRSCNSWERELQIKYRLGEQDRYRDHLQQLSHLVDAMQAAESMAVQQGFGSSSAEATCSMTTCYAF